MTKMSEEPRRGRKFWVGFFTARNKVGTGGEEEGFRIVPRHYFTRNRIITLALLISSLPVFIAVWWYMAVYIVPFNYLPTPEAVLAAFGEAWTRNPATGLPLMTDIVASLTRFLEGFVLAFVVAVPLGLLIGASKYAESFAKPIVEVLRPIPPIAWVPFLLLWLGYLFGPVLVVFIGAFFPVLSNVIFGVKSVDPLLIDAARTQGAKRWAIFSKVIMPYSVPFMMTGVRIALGVGWMCIVAAEFLAAKGGGIGQAIVSAMNIFRFDLMFAGMITVGILGIITLWGSKFIEDRVSEWMGMR